MNFKKAAREDLRRLDRTVQIRIAKYLRERVAPLPNPRSVGDPLSGELKRFWRYRVGDYRVICDIQDAVVTVVVVKVGHRRDVYRN